MELEFVIGGGLGFVGREFGLVQGDGSPCRYRYPLPAGALPVDGDRHVDVMAFGVVENRGDRPVWPEECARTGASADAVSRQVGGGDDMAAWFDVLSEIAQHVVFEVALDLAGRVVNGDHAAPAEAARHVRNAPLVKRQIP